MNMQNVNLTIVKRDVIPNTSILAHETECEYSEFIPYENDCTLSRYMTIKIEHQSSIRLYRWTKKNLKYTHIHLWWARNLHIVMVYIEYTFFFCNENHDRNLSERISRNVEYVLFLPVSLSLCPSSVQLFCWVKSDIHSEKETIMIQLGMFFSLVYVCVCVCFALY